MKGDVVLNAFCSRKADTSNISLNESDVCAVDFLQCLMAPLCIINLINIELTCFHNKMMLQYAKNHAKWFRHCEDMESQTWWPLSFGVTQ